jgi:hypothetical protein
MQIKTSYAGTNQISEIISDQILITKADDVLDIMSNAHSPYIVLHKHNLAEDFFDLSTRKLGEVLQKLATYRVNLAIIGDFSKFTSPALRALIYEMNSQGHCLFLPSIEEVKNIWARQKRSLS